MKNFDASRASSDGSHRKNVVNLTPTNRNHLSPNKSSIHKAMQHVEMDISDVKNQNEKEMNRVNRFMGKFLKDSLERSQKSDPSITGRS